MAPATGWDPLHRTWFRDWFDSPYYHKLYFERNEAEAARFISRLLAHLDPPRGARMLDVACGKGRHARILAEKGFDVTGFDLSSRSIEFARRFETESLHFYIHDMRQIFRTNYFDYAVNLYTSFGYFSTDREHRSAIRTISLALKKEGLLVLDYLNTPYVEKNLVPRSEKEIDGVIYYLDRWSDSTHFYKRIRIEDKSQKDSLEYIEKVAKFSLETFRELFSGAGLQLREAFGDYELAPYNTDSSPRLLMIAKKV